MFVPGEAGWADTVDKSFSLQNLVNIPGLYSSLDLNNIGTFKFLFTRMVLQQKKVLSQFELQQKIRLESLKQKLQGLHHLESELENQLKVDEG